VARLDPDVEAFVKEQITKRYPSHKSVHPATRAGAPLLPMLCL